MSTLLPALGALIAEAERWDDPEVKALQTVANVMRDGLRAGCTREEIGGRIVALTSMQVDRVFGPFPPLSGS